MEYDFCIFFLFCPLIFYLFYLLFIICYFPSIYLGCFFVCSNCYGCYYVLYDFLDIFWLLALLSCWLVVGCSNVDIALAPMEACKVRIQTQPGYANTLRECGPKMHAEEGLKAFYKGLYPLWLRQIPYTMMKFACFERTVETLYKYIVPKPRSECSKPEQLVVTFVAGYIAGVFCAVVSHPADSVVSVLNKEKGSSAVEVVKRFYLTMETCVWKGLFARIIMIGTLTALQWFIYDSVKVYFRLPRPPPPEMPESLKRKMGLLDC
uniref:Solute carrier family 25 member 3 n=1 Tax=Sinocyclocheilus anshuiensis TaxID=1608454 RepID=A0A671QWH6_9TELE